MNGAHQDDPEPGLGPDRGERENHPAPHRLEQFMRGGGGLPGSEVQAVVRHLLTECPQCVAVTRGFWNLGEGKHAVQILAEDKAAQGRRSRRTVLEDRLDAI